VGGGDLFDDRQPEPGVPGDRARAGLEEVLADRVGNSGPVVLDEEPVREVTDTDLYVVAGVFHAITNEVLEQVAESVRVGQRLAVDLD